MTTTTLETSNTIGSTVLPAKDDSRVELAAQGSPTTTAGSPPVNLRAMRVEYKVGMNVSFSPANQEDPMAAFIEWLQEAVAAYDSCSERSKQEAFLEVNAMSLATATPNGIPSVRIVLLKEFSPSRGFVFFTNYASRKGQELETNPRAAVTFYWSKLQRTVRAEGVVQRTSEEESDEYFASRPFGSKCAAVAAMQSRYLSSLEEFDQRYLDVERKHCATGAAHGDTVEEDMSRELPVPRPATWGGFVLAPLVLEFWQGMPNRCHRRVVFERASPESHTWTRRFLTP